jgi:hypothetical protein
MDGESACGLKAGRLCVCGGRESAVTPSGRCAAALALKNPAPGGGSALSLSEELVVRRGDAGPEGGSVRDGW